MSTPESGFEKPNHTQAPNSFFDELLPQISSLAELKVTLAIIRNTFGWHVQSAKLSFTELEKLTGLSRQSVADGLELGMQRGTIRREAEGNGFAYRLVVKNLDQSKKLTSQESRPEVVKEIDRQIVKNLDQHIDKEKEKEKKESNGSRGSRSPAVQVFEYWRRVLGHPTAKQTPERAKAVKARLREGYTVEQICAAIDGCRASPFHCGENERGQRYDDLTLICRNGSKLESFIALTQNGHRKGAATSDVRLV